MKMNEPNYVVSLGNEYQLSVKYSKGTLLQLLIGKTYNLTMFNVPRIAINSFQEKHRLHDKEIDDKVPYNGLHV